MNSLRQETIKKLEELKESLSKNLYEDSYAELISIATDYDNGAQDNLYLYDTINECVEFIGNEELKYYLQNEIERDVDRIFYIVQDVHNVCGVYVFDGYGNLRDIDDTDFEYCIETLIDKLKEE